jgi:predicted alpha/beta-hydrolase family hydrolase
VTRNDVVETSAGPARVALENPRGASGLVVLTHGASGGVETADLLAVRAALVGRGIAVALVTQPYRVAGRRTPPAPARQDEAWLDVIRRLRRRSTLRPLPLIVGGRSNGARVACRTALASQARAVVALAFPLHPPGRPETSRLAELEQAGVPVLVVQGSADPFGCPPPGPDRDLHLVAGADHSLRRHLPEIAQTVCDFVEGVVTTSVGA